MTAMGDTGGGSRVVPWKDGGNDSTVRSAATLQCGDGGFDGNVAIQIEEITSSMADNGKSELGAMVAFHEDGERMKE